jgi:hypothetical protein
MLRVPFPLMVTPAENPNPMWQSLVVVKEPPAIFREPPATVVPKEKFPTVAVLVSCTVRPELIRKVSFGPGMTPFAQVAAASKGPDWTQSMLAARAAKGPQRAVINATQIGKLLLP